MISIAAATGPENARLDTRPIMRELHKAGRRKAPPEEDKLCGIVDRQGAEHHRIDQAENRGVGPDPECERKHGGNRESPVSQQRPDPVTHIL